METVKIELKKEELAYLINDTIAYIWGLEDRCSTEDNLRAFGYYDRKELLEKLQKIEAEAFPKLSECC